MLQAQTVVEGPAVFDIGAEVLGNEAWLVTLDGIDIHLGGGADETLKLSASGAPLSHEKLVVPNNDLGIDPSFEFWADASGKFVENLVSVLFDSRLDNSLRNGVE